MPLGRVEGESKFWKALMTSSADDKQLSGGGIFPAKCAECADVLGLISFFHVAEHDAQR